MLIVQQFFLCYTELKTNAISRHLLAFSKIIHRHMLLSASFHRFLWSRFWFRVRHFSRLYLEVHCNRYDVIPSTKGRQRTDLLPTSAHRQTKHPSAICYSAQKERNLAPEWIRLVSRDEDYYTGFRLERMRKATKNTNQNFRKLGQF